MNRPDDVSAEAWEMAMEWWRKDGCSAPSANNYARAIDAAMAKERERCAQVLNDKAEEIRSTGTVTANTMARIFDEQSAAIRKGA